jgi:hypothetical protein
MWVDFWLGSMVHAGDVLISCIVDRAGIFRGWETKHLQFGTGFVISGRPFVASGSFA